MPVDVYVEAEIDLIPDIAAGLSGCVSKGGGAGGVVQEVAFVRQIEAMVLGGEMGPGEGVQVELGVEVVDVLPAHAIDPPEVIITEGEKLVEGGAAAIGQIVVARGKIVAQPELRVQRLSLEVVASAGGNGKGRDILVGILAELVHALQFV